MYNAFKIMARLWLVKKTKRKTFCINQNTHKKFKKIIKTNKLTVK